MVADSSVLSFSKENPFVVFRESAEIYEARRMELQRWAAERKEVEDKWRDEHRELARKLQRFLSGEMPDIDYNKVEIKPDTATRVASATMLGLYAEHISITNYMVTQ